MKFSLPVIPIKRKTLIVFATVVLLGILVAVGVWYQRKSSPPKEKMIGAIPTPTIPQDLATWDDPAGFSFQYTKGMSVDPHLEDEENYAHVELTDTGHPGRIVVWMKDTNASSIADWLSGEKSLKDVASIDTTLGGGEAKKIVVREPKKKLITAALDEDVVVIVEAEPEDETFWKGVYDSILSSFVFASRSTTASQAGPESETAAADEVENVE